MVGSAGSIAVINLSLFAILARLLGPGAFGVIAIATAIIDLLVLLGRLSIPEVLIRQNRLDEIDYSTSFWFSLVSGLCLSAILYFCAGFAADTFALPELEAVFQLLAITAVIFSIGGPYEARIRKTYGFKYLAARNVSSTLMGGFVAIIAALSGMGVYSLVLQRLISVTWMLVSMVIATKWIPNRRFSIGVFKVQFRHGATLTVASFLSNGNQRIVDLIIGYFLGSVALGYLKVAWKGLDAILDLVVRPIAFVTLTTLSEHAGSRGDLNTKYVELIAFASALIFPAFCGLSFISPFFILWIFGDAWQQSIVPMQILTLMGFVVPLIYFKNNYLTVAGKFDVILKLNFFEFAMSCLFAIVFSQISVEMAAFGNLMRLYIVTPIILIVMQYLCDLRSERIVGSVLKPFFATVIMSFVLLIPTLYFGWPQQILPVLIYVFVGVIIYVCLIHFMEPRLAKVVYAKISASW